MALLFGLGPDLAKLLQPNGTDQLDLTIGTLGQTAFTVSASETRTRLFLNGELLPKSAYALAPPNLTYLGTVTLEPTDVLTLV